MLLEQRNVSMEVEVTYIREGDARVVQRKSDRFPFAGDVLVVGKVGVPV